jgi:hypothetical protein
MTMKTNYRYAALVCVFLALSYSLGAEQPGDFELALGEDGVTI